MNRIPQNSDRSVAASDETHLAQGSEAPVEADVRQFLEQLRTELTDDEIRQLQNSQDDAASMALLSFC